MAYNEYRLKSHGFFIHPTICVPAINSNQKYKITQFLF